MRWERQGVEWQGVRKAIVVVGVCWGWFWCGWCWGELGWLGMGARERR